MKVKELIDAERRQWDVEKLKRFVNPSSVLKVVQTPIRWTEGQDIFIWPHSKTGEYTVKSSYHVIKCMESNTSLAPSGSSIISEKF